MGLVWLDIVHPGTDVESKRITSNRSGSVASPVLRDPESKARPPRGGGGGFVARFGRLVGTGGGGAPEQRVGDARRPDPRRIEALNNARAAYAEIDKLLPNPPFEDWDIANRRVFERFGKILDSGRTDLRQAWADFCLPLKPFNDFLGCFTGEPTSGNMVWRVSLQWDHPAFLRMNEALRQLNAFREPVDAEPVSPEFLQAVRTYGKRPNLKADSYFVLGEGAADDPTPVSQGASTPRLAHLDKALEMMDSYPVQARRSYLLFTMGLPPEEVWVDIGGNAWGMAHTMTIYSEDLHKLWKFQRVTTDSRESKQGPARPDESKRAPDPAPAAVAKPRPADERWAAALDSLKELRTISRDKKITERIDKWINEIDGGLSADRFKAERFKNRTLAKLIPPKAFTDLVKARGEIAKLHQSFIELEVCPVPQMASAPDGFKRAIPDMRRWEASWLTRADDHGAAKSASDAVSAAAAASAQGATQQPPVTSSVAQKKILRIHRPPAKAKSPPGYGPDGVAIPEPGQGGGGGGGGGVDVSNDQGF